MKSTPFFTNENMDSKISINECLKESLLLFIKKHDGSTIFWQDLAAIYCAKDTVKFMNDHNIVFVSKDRNPAAVTEDRKIENYWALVMRKLKKEPKAARNDQDFKYRWIRASSRVTQQTIKVLMSSVREKVKARSLMIMK